MAELETALLVLLLGSHLILGHRVYDCNKRIKRIEKVIVIDEIPRLVKKKA